MSQGCANMCSMETTPQVRPFPTPLSCEGQVVDEALLAAFPVLVEVPELARVLSVARQLDRLVASLLDGLLVLRATGWAEVATGVALEQWLAIVGRRTGSDRRMLLTACEVLERFPALRDAFVVNAEVSWAQLRTVVLQLARLPRHLDARLDGELVTAMLAAADDPDAFGMVVSRALQRIEPAPGPPAPPPPAAGEFFGMQPRLDGTGGRVWGEFGPIGFATLDAALNTVSPGAGAAKEGFAAASDPAGARKVAAGGGRARAARLLALVEHDCTDTAREGGRSGRRPQLLIRIELDTLLDRDRLPVTVLTSLTGGRMWADAATIRTLIQERGADLRTVVFEDTGRMLGVGRRTRIPPGWLADALLALHDTCSAPGCRVAARVCQLDHARPWHPRHPDEPGGSTEVPNLAPLCGTDNAAKEPDGWTATQALDGTRLWRHARTGLATRTLPATWQPPPPAITTTRPPDGPDPPAADPPAGTIPSVPDVDDMHLPIDLQVEFRAPPSEDIPF